MINEESLRIAECDALGFDEALYQADLEESHIAESMREEFELKCLSGEDNDWIQWAVDAADPADIINSIATAALSGDAIPEARLTNIIEIFRTFIDSYSDWRLAEWRANR